MDMEKLIEEAEKLKIEPTYDTNWCDLPPEIKLKCIETFKLKERLLLRCTGKTDRELVDSLKMEFDSASFTITSCPEIIIYGSHRIREYLKFPKNHDYKYIVPLIEFLLKIGTFNKVSIDVSPDITVTDLIQKPKEGFSVKNLNINSSSNEDILFWLESLKNGSESIRINADDDREFPHDKLVKIPSIINVPVLKTLYIPNSNLVFKLAQVWIDNDVEEGRVFQASTQSCETVRKFQGKFAERTLDNDSAIKIRTNNPKKHILLQCFESQWDDADENWDPYFELISLRVISAEENSNRFGWSDYNRQWIKELAPIPEYVKQQKTAAAIYRMLN